MPSVLFETLIVSFRCFFVVVVVRETFRIVVSRIVVQPTNKNNMIANKNDDGNIYEKKEE